MTGGVIVSALVVGRVVGLITQCIMLIETSTLFVNNRAIMVEMGMDNNLKYASKYKINGILLLITFFLGRVVFMGMILVFYLIPIMINYDYATAISEVGWFKIRWA